MTRRLTATLAALEALLVVGVGLSIPLALGTVLWAAQFGFQLDWIIFWRAAADLWLLGHGVTVTFQLDPATALALGVDGVGDPFVVTLALLGFALLTALLGVRLGRRLRAEPHRILGELVAVTAVLVLSALVVLSAGHPAALPSRWQGALFPALVYGLGVAIGSIGATNPARVRLRRLIADAPPLLTGIGGAALRTGLGAVATVVLAGSLLTTTALVLGFGQVIALYESVQAGVLGGLALTLGQLALLPTVVLWSASWLIGPGFALGAGSIVSPVAVSLGPLPAIPLLGALPAGESPLGYLTLLVPIAAAFAAGLAVRPRLADAVGRAYAYDLPLGARVGWSVLTGFLAGVIAGLAMGFLAWLSAGSAGPGRLAVVGPDPVAVGVWMLAETLIGVTLGLLAAGARAPRRPSPARSR
jgi:hypothetical protein